MHLLLHFIRNKLANASILAATSIAVTIGVTSFAVDFGSFYYQKLKLQSAADLSAIAAASDLSQAEAAADASLQANGYDASVLQTLTFGTYDFDSSIPAAQRFTPGASGADAVQVTLQIQTPIYFGRIFSLFSATPAHAQTREGGSTEGVTVGAEATAVSANSAAFAIGSGLAQIDGGVLNSVLGALIGTNLSLSVVDYQSLASANIDLFEFSNALASRADVTAVTYSDLAQGSFRVTDLYGAILDTAQTDPQLSASGVATQINELVEGTSNPYAVVSLAPLLSYGPYASRSIGSTPPMYAAVSALDLITAIAELANGEHQVQAALAVDVPGIASANLDLAIGERPVGTSFVALGAPGASVHTAQTRLLLTVQLVPDGVSSTVNLPIYIELASGTATLSNVTCSSGDVTSSEVTLDVTPSIIDSWIGNVSDAELTDFTSEPNPTAATLLDLSGLVSVTGLANATLSNLAPTPVTFTYPEIQDLTKETTSTEDYTASLLSSLIGNLQLNVTVIGLSLGVPSTLSQTVAQTAATATTPIDELLTSVLGSLGVSLGQAATWVSGVRCGDAVLVN